MNSTSEVPKFLFASINFYALQDGILNVYDLVKEDLNLNYNCLEKCFLLSCRDTSKIIFAWTKDMPSFMSESYSYTQHDTNISTVSYQKRKIINRVDTEAYMNNPSGLGGCSHWLQRNIEGKYLMPTFAPYPVASTIKHFSLQKTAKHGTLRCLFQPQTCKYFGIMFDNCNKFLRKSLPYAVCPY